MLAAHAFVQKWQRLHNCRLTRTQALVVLSQCNEVKFPTKNKFHTKTSYYLQLFCLIFRRTRYSEGFKEVPWRVLMVLCASAGSPGTTSRHFDSFFQVFCLFFWSRVFVLKQTAHTCHSSILPIIDILCLRLPYVGFLVTRSFAVYLINPFAPK